MEVTQILTIVQLINSIAVIGLVLMQQPDAGFYSQSTTVNKTKTGSEKFINRLTIFFVASFIITAFSFILVK